MADIIDGKKIRDIKRSVLSKRVEALKEKGKVPSLISLQVGHDPNSQVYLNAQQKNATKLGIEYKTIHFEDATSTETLIYNIKRLNEKADVDGIIIQTPLPGHLDYNNIIRYVALEKDVEGTHPQNMGRLALGDDVLAPPTAKAVIDMLDFIDVDYYGKDVVMVGHSDIVGKPLALMLMNRMATVSVCHVATAKAGRLSDYTHNADILIVAVGKAELISGDSVKDGAIIVDVGINYSEGKIKGDVEFTSAEKKASWISPVPGGVGSVTSMALMENLLLLAERKFIKK